MALFVFSVLLALTVSALCSLVEAALLSLTPSQVANLSRKQPAIGAIWQRFKANVEQPIAVILLLNTSAHTIGAAVAGSQFDDLFGDEWIVAFSLIFTAVMLQFTEILPKSLGVRFNAQVATWAGRPLEILVLVFKPILAIVHFINRPFEGRKHGPDHPATVEEITALAGLARLSNQIDPYQERIILGASRLSQLRVEEIMIPVAQVSFLSATQSLADALVAAHVEAHTRFPVLEGTDRDKVVGYINFKELIYYMRTNPGDPSLRGIIRPMQFVKPDVSAADLLKTFAGEHVHIALVRDAAGMTLGMVTFEDVVEELVGDLEDEFDRLPRSIHPLTGGTWMIGGGTPIADVAQKLGLELPTAAGTVSAWLLQKFERIPRPGEAFRSGTHEFVVRRIRRGKVFEAAVHRKVS